MVPRARELGLGIVAREAFFKGELFDIGAEIGVTDKAALARLALAFVVRQDPGVILLGVLIVFVLVFGTAWVMAHMNQNMMSMHAPMATSPQNE